MPLQRKREELKSGLARLYEGVTREPVPDEFAALLAKLDEPAKPKL